MKKLVTISLAAIIAMLIFPFAVFGSVGVGVGTGKIQVDKPLKPGSIYNAPPLTVINTGSEPSEYTVSIDYSGNQTQLKPNKEWFSFEPLQFHLEPNQSQIVQIKMTLPIKTVPGDYFAYLQAQPTKKTTTAGSTTIGVAAAAKLYFTIAPANIWQGIYYRVVSFWTMYSPWTWVILGIVLAAVVITLFRKFFAFQIAVRKK